MRSTIDGPDIFFRKMKKKPALQAIIDNLDSYTEEQLSRVDGQPLWIRNALVNMKRNGGQYLMTRDEIADAMAIPNSIQLTKANTQGELFEWTGNPAWLGDTTSGIKLEQEIVTGEPIFMVSDDSCYLGDTLVRLSTASQQSIAVNARSHGVIDRQTYKEVHQRYLAQKHGKLRT